jgi:mRNA interferase HicA
MKRTAFLKFLRQQGCKFLREGANHSWWQNTSLNKRSAIPRHSEINDILVRKICKDLGIDYLKKYKT